MFTSRDSKRVIVLANPMEQKYPMSYNPSDVILRQRCRHDPQCLSGTSDVSIDHSSHGPLPFLTFAFRSSVQLHSMYKVIQ